MNRKFIKIKSRIKVYLTTMLFLISQVIRIKAQRSSNGKSRVLLFHHLDDIKRFENIIKELCKRYKIISFDDYIEGRANKCCINIIIALDDGYRSWYSSGYPIFRKYNIKPLLFINSNFIGLREADAQLYCKHKILTWPEVALTNSELFELHNFGATIGGHTEFHENLLKISNWEREEASIINDKAKIEKIIRSDISCFAYPFGLYNRESISAVKKAEYEYAFTCIPGFLDDSSSNYELNRNNIGLRHPFSICAEVEGWNELIFNTVKKMRALLKK